MDNVRADESVVQEKIQALRKLLSRNAPLLIAYSGGVDSTFLLAEATGVASIWRTGAKLGT
jgi:PP-loop superfamily ATP-utilizing enzyme